MRFSIRQLEVIRAVADNRRVSAAAKALKVAQPAITRYLRGIEREFGVLLFDRTAKGMVPTPVCEAILHRASIISAELLGIKEDVRTLGASSAKRLVIGITPSVSSIFPKSVIRQLADAPGTVVIIREDVNRTLFRGLRDGEIDLIFAPIPPEELSEGLVQQVLFYNHASIVARHGHPLARRKSISPVNLLAYPWILPTRIAPARQQLEIAFNQVKLLPPRPFIECDSPRITREMLLCSDCISVMVKDAVRPEIERNILRVLEVKLSLPIRPMAILTRQMSAPTPAIAQFIKLLRQEIDRSDAGSGTIPLA